MSDAQSAADVKRDGLSTNSVDFSNPPIEYGGETPTPLPTSPLAAQEGGEVEPLREVYRFRDMENMRKAHQAQVIYRLGEFRKCVMLVGADWYEEKYDRKTGLVTYHLCSPERRAEIVEQVRK